MFGFTQLLLPAGILILAFDRPIANAMNLFSIALGEEFGQLRWRRGLPAWPYDRFEDFLSWVRLLGVVIALGGISACLAWLLGSR